MKLKHLTSAAMMAASWLLAGSCALDERELTLGGIGGSSTYGPDGSAPNGPEALPRLAVSTTAIDLGWVTRGFAARARIRVDNVGTAPLPAPAVALAAGSHADFALIQNGCARELAAGESCELRVQLVPSGDGERAATLEVRSEVGGEARVALNGLGLAGGDLILAPVAGSFEDFGGARIGTTQEETFSISNPTDVPSGPLRFRVNRPEFQLLAPGEGDCVPDVTSLVGGQSCTLRLAFTPAERGPLEATLTGATDGVGAVSVTLAGRGLAPAALCVSAPGAGCVSAPMVDFAGVVLLSSAQRNVRFENVGDEPLTLAGARLAPENAEGFSILDSDCGAGTQLAGGASCSLQLEFRPPRVGEELRAELIAEGAEAGQMQSVALRGIGLEPGALTVSAAAGSNSDFGEVLLGESSERTFQIQNPSAQASGVLDIVVSEGFALVEPAALAEGVGAAGECIPGSASLVDGEACTVRVRFVPSRREAVTGSLTISSPLAGATELPLAGRGVVPPLLAVESELNFGRVLTGASGVRTLAIENDGDQPLPPPSFELTGGAPAQVAAFSVASQCAAPLALGETCDLNLTFAPTNATAHAVTLNIGWMGKTTSVLLLGEAQVPGSLVLSATGNDGAFGDVPIGTTTTRAIVLTNPGQIPSGRVTIISDSNRFAVDPGNCNQGDPAGLVDGASCTFNVSFTPDDNLPQAVNLTVQSPGAGIAGMQLSGRGRQPAELQATGNRDLGRAYIGQAAVAANEFTWTVNNTGDLPTGTLTVQNNNSTEFTVRNDSCAGSAVLGRASCQMVIRFQPSAIGNRSARVVVTDPTGGRSTTLVVTGLGVQLAALGQSCVNAECSAGVCTRGVCCDRACDRTCQVCSAQGQCINQSNQEVCGDGAACFGVDNCKLPAGRACSQNGGDAQCGSGQCERRLGGTGAGDRVCCLDDCGNALQCNAQNRCQAPALGAGEACGAAGQAQCAAGLECKDCRGGGRRCTAPNDCCGGCDNPLECSSGECVCRVLSNGQRGLDCGGGLCALNREGACCVGFEPAGCNCDPSDNLCKECLDNSDCAAGRFCNAQKRCIECNNGDVRCVQGGGRQQCNNGFWQNANCQNGQTCVNNGQCGCGGNTPVPCGNRCIQAGQCCDIDDCNLCQQCNTNNTCGPLGAGQADRCPGAQVCNAGGQCVQCTADAQCGNGQGCRGNACVPLQPNGGTCSQDSDCASNDCNRFVASCDGDDFAPANPVASENRCGTTPPAGAPAGCPAGSPATRKFVAAGGQVDCCDSDPDARPGQALFFTRVRTVCGGYDFNCVGGDEPAPVQSCTDFGVSNCPGSVISTQGPCGGQNTILGCATVDNLQVPGPCNPAERDDCLCGGVRGALGTQACR